MMTTDEHYAGLNAASSDIRRAVDAAYMTMLDDIRAGMSARKAAAKAFSSFSGEFKDVLRHGLSERMGYPVSDAALSAYPVGDVKLSTRLYRQATATGVITASIVKTEAKSWQDARRLALNLYEGYGFRTKETLQVRTPLPKYLRAAVDESEDMMDAWAVTKTPELISIVNDDVVGPSLSRELAKMQASTLKTPALKASYLQVIEGLENGVGQDRLQKLLKTAWHERNRYFANRIAQTELHRAYTTAQAQDIMADTEVQAVQIRMSGSHPRTDICDYFSRVDLYGMGPGVYPKDKAPRPPFHPHCRCVAHRVFAYQTAIPRLRKDAPGAFLRSMDTSEAAKVLGSRDRLQDALNGADPLDIWNRHTDPMYRVGKVGDVAKAGGLGVDGGMSDAYDIAKNGGKHRGLYERYKDSSEKEISRSIRSYEKQNELHFDKINDPMKYVDTGIQKANLEDLVGRYWPQEIERNKAKIAVMEGILNERK